VMKPPRRRGTSTGRGVGQMGSPTLTSTWNGIRARERWQVRLTRIPEYSSSSRMASAVAVFVS
jgi:hypothetical protein